MAIESFAIHTRCLMEFLWTKPHPNHPDDVRAVHFCSDWQTGGLPHALAGVSDRVDGEIVHLTYGRQRVVQEAKGWKFDAIYTAIAARLRDFADTARPERLTDSARRALRAFAQPSWGSERAATLASATTMASATTTYESDMIRAQPEPGTIRFPLPEDS